MEDMQLRAMAMDLAVKSKCEPNELLSLAQVIFAFIKGEIQ